MATMTMTASANETWQNALRLRKALREQLEKTKAGTSGIQISQLEAANGILEKFRLDCVKTVFLDFEFAVKNLALEMLWDLHTSIRSEYRNILARLKSSSHVVERRKTEKLFLNFLRIAQKFYQGFIQRLSAIYDIPQLKKAAKGIQVEQMTTSHHISPVPPQLIANVLRSCHDTLLHLGDLARYTVQARHKNTGYELALTYFALAQHILPKLGFAFHQMGIVNIAQGNHLDCVYHFYRAWAIKLPHPNAKSNLETEFKSLKPPTSVKSKRASSGPHDTFILWFVRLHALFYKGEETPQREEVEREVIHRLEIAAGNGASRDVILRMSLINMAAQHIAALKFSESRSVEASRFYEYILHFNIKFLTVFASVLETDLKENLPTADDVLEDESEPSPQIAESLLPALRCYCMWLAASREQVFADASTIATRNILVRVMTNTVARVFTLLCEKKYSGDNPVSCPYLLPEDLDILGLEPLSEKSVPDACRSFCLPDGQLKPQLDIHEQRFDPQREKLARILDILRCAYFLAEERNVPLSHCVVENLLVFEYKAVDVRAQPRERSRPSAARKEPTAVVSTTINVQKRHAAQIVIQDRRRTPNAPSFKQPEIATASALAPAVSIDKTDQVGDAEKTVINMLAPFLRPPSSQPQRSPKESDAQPTDFEFRHSLAVDLLSTDCHPDPSATQSIPSGKFEPLPWEWFNTPKPARDRNSPRSAAGMSPNTPALSSGKFDDPFNGPWTPTSGHPDSAFRRANSHYVHTPKSSMVANDGSTAEHVHRATLLQSFGSAARSSPAALAAARTSPFSKWGETKGSSSRQGQHVRLSSPPNLWAQETMPQSSLTSNQSQFSHPSSLYHGTPTNGLHHFSSGGGGGGGGVGQGQVHTGGVDEEQILLSQQLLLHQQRQQQNKQQMMMATQRYSQANTTSSYDEAVFRSAFEGRR